MVEVRHLRKPERTRVRWAAVAAAALTLASQPAMAAEKCPPLPKDPPRLLVTTKEGPVVLHNAFKQAELERLSKKTTSSSALGRGWTPAGLTTAITRPQVRVRVSGYDIAKNRSCAVLTEVELTVEHEAYQIYISERHPVGSCRYNDVLAHEREHVAIFQRTLKAFKPHIQKRLVKATAGLGVVYASSIDAAAGHLRDRIKKDLDPLIDELDRAQKAANAAIDTKENYELEQRRCLGQ